VVLVPAGPVTVTSSTVPTVPGGTMTKSCVDDAGMEGMLVEPTCTEVAYKKLDPLTVTVPPDDTVEGVTDVTTGGSVGTGGVVKVN
jgi:hypothetical protein